MPWLRRSLRPSVLVATLCGSIALACTLSASVATQKVFGSDSPQIIFDGTPANKSQLYLVNSGGLLYTAFPLIPASETTCCAVWSPDGTRLAYLTFPLGGNRADLYVADVNGTTLTRETRLTNTPANESSPVWSPDGHQLVFQSDRDGNWEIYRIDLDLPGGPVLVRLTNNRVADITPHWSPTGNQIAFISNRGWTNELFLMNDDGSNQHPISQASLMWASDYSWSPDGLQLVFSGQHTGNREIYTARADGSGMTRLTNTLANDVNPLWSPLGDKIAFQTNRNGNSEIYLINPDGSQPTNLTSNPAYDGAAAWSPDGLQLAFISMRNGNREVYTVNADGTNFLRLTTNDRDDDRPAWRPTNQSQP